MSCSLFYIYITINIMQDVSYIHIYNGYLLSCEDYTHYSGIALRLFVCGAGCSNLNYNIQLVCELLMEFFGLFTACTYIFKFAVVYI
jgi:hypothetical protein